jgi:hypothetical protein
MAMVFSSGMSFCNALSASSRSSALKSILVSSRSKCSRLIHRENSLGTVPSNLWLRLRFRYLSDRNLPTADGMAPLKLFEDASMIRRRVSADIVSGIQPT